MAITSKLLRRTMIADAEWSLWETRSQIPNAVCYEAHVHWKGNFERRDLGKIEVVAVTAFDEHMNALRERVKQ
jgi:hypothetical protein